MAEVSRNARQSGDKLRSTFFLEQLALARVAYASQGQIILGQEFLQRIDVVIVPTPLEMVVLAFRKTSVIENENGLGSF